MSTEPNTMKNPAEKTGQLNQSNPFSALLYKVTFVCIFIALLPLFPSSQSPELSSKSFFTHSWELLHLLVVGIAISYGLFSRRNPDQEIEKEIQSKPDTPQSYVSQILEVSSVFDDNEEAQSPIGLGLTDETKNQTWNYSQYSGEEPVIMVAKESGKGSNSSTKPLFLPVRSLKSFDRGNELEDANGVGKIGSKESVVLPSPIPWRSRSGRIEEVKEESSSPPPCSPLNSSLDTESIPSRTPSFRSPTPPKRLSPSPSLSSEIRGKTNEDLGRKKSFHKSSPPPPPPPPPPPFNYATQFASEKRDARKSFKDELEDISRRGREFLQSDNHGSGSFNSENGRSVQTVRSKEAQGLPPLRRNRREKKIDEFREKMIITSDSESDADDDSELYDVEESSASVSTEAVPEENEVDKKADEFIAKFREQIRLQRIASMKKSTGQRTTRSSK